LLFKRASETPPIMGSCASMSMTRMSHELLYSTPTGKRLSTPTGKRLTTNSASPILINKLVIEAQIGEKSSTDRIMITKPRYKFFEELWKFLPDFTQRTQSLRLTKLVMDPAAQNITQRP